MKSIKVMIFGGTAEGRKLAWIHTGNGADVTISVATGIGEEMLRKGDLPPEGSRFHTIVGRMDCERMQQVMRGFDLCIDATHPYAVEASGNIREACSKLGIEYLRVTREPSELDLFTMEDADILDQDAQLPDLSNASSAEAACRILLHTAGNILLTTGSKELGAFSDIPRERLYVRVLPTQAAIEACEENGIPHRNIIAMFGPFTQKMNEATFGQYNISYLVTKDSGRSGGFEEKLYAAMNCRVKTIVIRRPEESGVDVREAARILQDRTFR